MVKDLLMIATEVKDIFPTRLWSSRFAAGPDRSVSVVIACVNFYNEIVTAPVEDCTMNTLPRTTVQLLYQLVTQT